MQPSASRNDVTKQHFDLVLSSLPSMDVDNNPEMNIDDVVVIQDSLLKNKQDYDDERYM